MSACNVWQLTGTETLFRLRGGTINVQDVVRSLLGRIHEQDPLIKAWVYLDEEALFEQAKVLDSVPADARRPLHGLPIGVKDIMLTKDMPTQYNSRLYESSRASGIDAAPVALLRAMGALIVGKLSTTEFATTPQGGWHQNHTVNPSDHSRTPGGSSSGSAAAVASYQVPIALGTQTGGSIIRPASFVGCYGWKPTWGVISREGLGQWCITLDTCGFFARSCADLELMADAFHLEDSEKALQIPPLDNCRIAFCQTPYWPKAMLGTQQAMATARRLLAEQGAECVELHLPSEFSMLSQWHGIIMAMEGKASFLGHHLVNSNLLHEQIRGYVENDRELTNEDLRNAYDGCARLRPIWDDIAAQYDAVIVPSVPDEAPMGIAHTGDMSLCSMWTVLHAPVINVPGLTGSNNLPVGLTVAAARFKDRTLLKLASMIGDAFAER